MINSHPFIHFPLPKQPPNGPKEYAALDQKVPDFVVHFVPWFINVHEVLTYYTNAEVNFLWDGRAAFGVN